MSAAQICLVAAAILGMNACAARGHIAPSPPPAASTARASQPAITRATSLTFRPARTPLTAPVTTPAPKAAIKATPTVAKTPAPLAQEPKPTAPPSASLDLSGLKKQLKETKAIGLFTKIALKNQVDDLLGQFRKYHQGKSKIDMMELRRSYNLLLMKVLSLLQNKDPKLASSIVSSREAIWDLLSDPKKFANLEV